MRQRRQCCHPSLGCQRHGTSVKIDLHIDTYRPLYTGPIDSGESVHGKSAQLFILLGRNVNERQSQSNQHCHIVNQCVRFHKGNRVCMSFCYSGAFGSDVTSYTRSRERSIKGSAEDATRHASPPPLLGTCYYIPPTSVIYVE
jgi:hypothetical protein